MATRLAYPQQYNSSASQSAQRHALHHQPPWAQPPYQGAPPIPQGISVNPQQWNAGVWQYNPAFNHNRNPNQQHVPWIPSQQWMPQSQPSSQASQQAAQQQQQVVNPYKRVPRPPSAEYLANKLSDNPLGLSNMIPAEEYYKQSSPEDVQTPWIWKPKDLDSEDQPTNGLRRQATEPVLGPEQPSRPEGFTAQIDLRPTFSPKIVRTPQHYNSSTSSPSRGSSWGSRGSTDLSSQMSQLSLGSSGSSSASSSLSRQSSLPPSFPPTPSPSRGDFPFSAPILAESISDEPDSMLSPLIIASTPKTGLSSLRPTRMHHSHPINNSSLQSIPEVSQPSSTSTSRKTSKDSHRQEVQHANSLPNLGPGTSSINYNQLNNNAQYPPPPPLPRIGSRHTTTAFIDPSPTKPSFSTSSSASSAAAAASSGGASSISMIGPPLQHPALVSVSSLTASSSPKTPSPRPVLAERSFSRQSSRASSAHPSPDNVHSSGSIHLTPPQQQAPSANPDRSTSYTPSPSGSVSASAAAATVAALTQSIHGTPSSSASAAASSSSSTTTRSPNPLPPPPQLTRRAIQLPVQKTPPPKWRSRIRRGFWNRRGDHLTLDGYIVYAPEEEAYPEDLRHYPLEDEGYLDHDGMWASYVVRPELPESLPRYGRPAEAPYEKFVVWEYKV